MKTARWINAHKLWTWFKMEAKYRRSGRICVNKKHCSKRKQNSEMLNKGTRRRGTEKMGIQYGIAGPMRTNKQRRGNGNKEQDQTAGKGDGLYNVQIRRKFVLRVTCNRNNISRIMNESRSKVAKEIWCTILLKKSTLASLYELHSHLGRGKNQPSLASTFPIPNEGS